MNLITTHVADAQAHLPEIISVPRVRALLAAFVAPIQELESVLWDLWLSRQAPTGHALDMIGAVVRQPRDGETDADYWRHIRARVATNRSSGTPEELINITRLIINIPGGIVRLDQQDVATIVIHIDDVYGPLMTQPIVDTLIEFLRVAKLAGVRLLLHYTFAGVDTFRFDTIGVGLDIGIFAGVVE